MESVGRSCWLLCYVQFTGPASSGLRLLLDWTDSFCLCVALAMEWLNPQRHWLAVVFQDVVRSARVRQDGGGSTPNPTLLRTLGMHANATLTPLTRAQMALQHSQLGFSLRTTALAFGVCEKTVRRWLAPALARSLLQASSPAPQDQPPARSPDPRSTPSTPLLRSDYDGPARLQGHPLPRPAPPSP